jgi:hypothetical protein
VAVDDEHGVVSVAKPVCRFSPDVQHALPHIIGP